MIAMTGIKLIVKEELTARTISIVGLSVAVGIGVIQVRAVWDCSRTGPEPYLGNRRS